MPRPANNRTVGDLGCDIRSYEGKPTMVGGRLSQARQWRLPGTIGYGVSPRQGQVAVRVRRDLFHLGLHVPGHPFCGADAAASVDDGDPAPGGRDAVVRLARRAWRSEEHTSELQSLRHLVCRLLLA